MARKMKKIGVNVQHPLRHRVIPKSQIQNSRQVQELINPKLLRKATMTSLPLRHHSDMMEIIFIIFLWWRHVISNKSFVKTIMMKLYCEKSNAKKQKWYFSAVDVFIIFLSSTFDGLLAGVCRSFLRHIWFHFVSSIGRLF